MEMILILKCSCTVQVPFTPILCGARVPSQIVSLMPCSHGTALKCDLPYKGTWKHKAPPAAFQNYTILGFDF